MEWCQLGNMEEIIRKSCSGLIAEAIARRCVQPGRVGRDGAGHSGWGEAQLREGQGGGYRVIGAKVGARVEMRVGQR